MSKVLARATRGRIRRGTTDKVLVLAVAGLMYFVGSDIVVPTPPSTLPGGGGKYPTTITRKPVTLTQAKKEEYKLLERIILEDSELIAIVQVCLKTIL